MMNFLRWLMSVSSKLVFALRYRVRAHGLEQVKGIAPALVLPNHPAYTDPPLVLGRVWPALKPRPMLLASALSNPLVAWMPRVLDAVEIPDLEKTSAQAREDTQQAIDSIIDTLKQGRNAILWPSGHLSSDGLEHLGSSRSLTDILQAVPEARIVLVRTEGLWGSRFSFAPTGEHPPSMVLTMLKGVVIVLSNLLFFTPRRNITITVQEIPRDELPELDRFKINRFLEDWYNTPEQAKPVFVPYHFMFGPRKFNFPKPEIRQSMSDFQPKPEVRQMVLEAFEQNTGRSVAQDQQVSATELDSLGLDSLERMELTLLIEQQSGFISQQVPMTLGDLYALAQGAADDGPPIQAPASWFAKPSTIKLDLLGDTLPKALLNRVLANGKDVAVADDISGVLTYEKFYVAVRTMSRRMAKIQAPNVAVMLPASVAADIVMAALHLAGKLPVMINWTTGQSNIDHAIKTMAITHIVSSGAFIDRLGISIDQVEFVYMEDLRQDIGKLELLRTLLRLRLAGKSMLRLLPAISPDDPAVVLFTSGSEKAPKAVPLTHRNILSNLRAVIETFDLTSEDRLLGFLPPFHSFGMTVTSVFPILAAIRAIHHPDPTAAAALGKKIGAYKATVVCGTPTFVGYILNRAKAEDVASVRLWVVGAEKCPPQVFEKVKEMTPNAHIVEGYGITECSPMISANRVEHNKPGTIGKALPGVQIMITDIDTLAPLPTDTQGMILVQGDNVFPGYIGEDMPIPFHEHDGQKWYVTGDLGSMDAQGFITFRGRLKRFIKAGGEMISLPAIEEPLSQEYPPTEDGPQVAVEGIETDKGRRIVLFTTLELTLGQANTFLSTKGMAGVMRLDAVKKIQAIPMLGTGKTDYKPLRKMIEEEVAEK